MKISLKMEPLEVFLLSTNFMEIDEITEAEFLDIFNEISQKEFLLDLRDIPIKFTNSKRRLGTIFFTVDKKNKLNENIKLKGFQFSRINFFSREISIDTIRHELCHYKVMFSYGYYDEKGKIRKNHGEEFLEMTKRYNCNFFKPKEEIAFQDIIFHPVKGKLFYKNWLFLQDEKK